MVNPGAGNSPTLTLLSPDVPCAGLEAWFCALTEISLIQIDPRSPLRMKGACGRTMLGGWYPC